LQRHKTQMVGAGVLYQSINEVEIETDKIGARKEVAWTFVCAVWQSTG